ncbi:MAG TPA: immunoglobulin domain-containing protein [Opitutaceae bacterium]|nr:immunoglobulin domain-containing protein [Opitutaceae bacterium]
MVAFAFSFAGPGTVGAADAQIDAAAVAQTIRGFGGNTVFLPTTPLTQPDLDLLFGNGPGQIGLTLLRIRVSTDAAWRTLELANAQGARARGAEVIATPWSPPAAMKSNNSLISGSLNPSSYAAYATYLNDFAGYMAANGAPLYAISVQNEPDIAVTYESCDWTPAQMLDFCRNHAGAITATRVIAPESFQFRKNISDPILNDPVAAANIAIVGGHIYGGGLAPYPLAAAKGKEVWMTEHLDLSVDWAGALATGKEIHDCLVTGNFNAYIWWYLRRFYGPLGEDSVVTKRGYVMAQFAKFVRPGFVRIGSTGNPTTGVYVSAFKRDKLVIVAINQTAVAVSQKFSLANGNVSAVTPWQTSSTANLALQPSIAITAASFTASLPAESVTTFVGDLISSSPTVVVPPQTQTVTAGVAASLSVTANGAAPVTYQWFFNGTAIAGATSPTFTIGNPQPSNTGDYAVLVSDAVSSVTSATAALIVKSAAASDARLSAISCRAVVGTGGDILIPGIVAGGTGPREVVVRASGPALIEQGVSGTLAQPQLQLFQVGVANPIATNTGWDTGTASATTALQAAFTASGLPQYKPNSGDCALLATLTAGSAYTAHVRGLGAAPTGVALIEVYDLGASSARMTALSCRAFVGTGGNILIPGIIILGSDPKQVIIRASGPALAAQGVGGTLGQPTLAVYSGGGAKIAENTGWSNVVNPATVAALTASVGLPPFPPGSADCTIIATLPPGGYTAQVSGLNATTGVALIEIYEVP